MHGTLERSAPAWFPDWTGETCAIIASGSSVTQGVVDSLKGRCRVAVVNNNHTLAPWADVLYAADIRWWDVHRGVCGFAGLKVIPITSKDDDPDARAVTVAAKRYGLRIVKLLDTPNDKDDPAAHPFGLNRGIIARGGNSAFQLVNLITQFGCKRQIWAGFDFCGERWHGQHPEPLKNPRPQTLEKWCKRLDANAPALAALGVEVINASTVSALTEYRKMSVEAALQYWGCHEQRG